MRELHVYLVVASHIASLAFAVHTTLTSGVRPHILLYAFLIDYLLRLGTIRALHRSAASPAGGWLRAVAPYVSRRPADGQPSYPITEGESGRPTGLSGYLIVMAACSFFAFMLANVDSDRELALDLATGVNDVSWAMVIGTVYWVNSLIARTMVIHPGQALSTNFGYNSREVTVLALAVLTGGVVVVARQALDYGASAWAVMGPLLAFRTAYDLSLSLQPVPAIPPAGPADPLMRAGRRQPRQRRRKSRPGAD